MSDRYEVGDRVRCHLVTARDADGEEYNPVCTVIDEDEVEYDGKSFQILNLQSDAGGSCEVFATSVFEEVIEELV